MNEPTSPTAFELSVVIPAYNEAARLPAFLDAVLQWANEKNGRSTEVIVVDDGSADETARVVAQRMPQHPNLTLLKHDKNSGKGAAVRTGMRAARGRWRLFADADGATRMDQFKRLEEAIAGGAAIAIASREGKGTKVEASALRRFLGRWFNRAVRAGAVHGIRDTQCGFKLFATPEAQALFVLQQENGFAFDVELLFLAQKHGIKVAEVPVDWTEIAGSKVSLLKDGLKMLKAVRRIKQRWKHGDYGD